MKESDLYLPLKQFLEYQNFTVKGEVQDCDVLAVRGNEPLVVVELKRALNLDVILQAVDRLALTSKVYIGIPKQSKSLQRRPKQMVKLLKMLGLGLIVIDGGQETNNVKVLVDPGAYRPRQSKPRRERLLGEFVKRVGDPNPGGVSKRKGIMTAYRQKALAIARLLRQQGPTKASQVALSLREPQARQIMYRNVYGWFERASYGVYQLSPRGMREISDWLPGCTDTASD